MVITDAIPLTNPPPCTRAELYCLYVNCSHAYCLHYTIYDPRWTLNNTNRHLFSTFGDIQVANLPQLSSSLDSSQSLIPLHASDGPIHCSYRRLQLSISSHATMKSVSIRISCKANQRLYPINTCFIINASIPALVCFISQS